MNAGVITAQRKQDFWPEYAWLQCKLPSGCVPFPQHEWLQSPVGHYAHEFHHHVRCHTSADLISCVTESEGRKISKNYLVSGLMCPVVHSSQSLHTGYTTQVSISPDFCNTDWLLSWTHNRRQRESTGFTSHFQTLQVGSRTSIQEAQLDGEMCNWFRMITAIIHVRFQLI